MGQKPSVAKLPGLIDVERHGELVRLSWNHRGSSSLTTIFNTMLVTLLLLVSFVFSVAKARAEAWILLTILIFGGLVAFFMARIALRWFWDESIELRPDTLTQVLCGPLAPKPKEVRRADIVDIRLIHDSEHEPLIRLTYRGPLINYQKLIGAFLSPEDLEVLDRYLHDWLCRHGEPVKPELRLSDSDE